MPTQSCSPIRRGSILCAALALGLGAACASSNRPQVVGTILPQLAQDHAQLYPLHPSPPDSDPHPDPLPEPPAAAPRIVLNVYYLRDRRSVNPHRSPDDRLVSCYGFYDQLDATPPPDYAELPTPLAVGATISFKHDGPGKPWKPVRYEISWGNTWDPKTKTAGDRIWTNVTHHAERWDLNSSDGILLTGVSKHNYGPYNADEPTTRIRARITFDNNQTIETASYEEAVVQLGFTPILWEFLYRSLWPMSFFEDADKQFRHRKIAGGTRHIDFGTTLGVLPDGGHFIYDCEDLRQEIDWGEGDGWQDITAEYEHYDFSEEDGLVEGELATHRYDTPGSYDLKLRRTYWDGLAATSDSEILRVIVDP